MRSELFVPGAIVTGAIIIALGLFFGLRGRQDGAVPSAVSSSANVAADVSPAGVSATARPDNPTGASASQVANVNVAPAVAFEPSSFPGNEKIAQVVRADLERHRARFVASCITPVAKDAGRPIKVSVMFAMAFDKEGRARMRGVADQTTGPETWPAVVDCLRVIDVPITGPASNAPFTVEIPLTLP